MIREWFNDRKRDRTPTVIGDRTVSPLWEVHSPTWRASYTSDLLDLINVLGLLIDAEAEQAALLGDIVANPLWTVGELEAAAVLPIPSRSRSVATRAAEDALF